MLPRHARRFGAGGEPAAGHALVVLRVKETRRLNLTA